MRILLACEFYHPSVGGVQEVMRQLAERFVAHGHEVTVATSFLAEREATTLNGVRIEAFKVSGNAVRGMTGEAEAYRTFIRRGDFDVLMVKAAQQWTFDALSPVLDAVKAPKVFIPCGFSGLYDPAYRSYFQDMPDILRKFDQLIFYASAYRDINFAKEAGLTAITVLSNGASEVEFAAARDPAFRARHEIPEDAFVVLTVGTFTGGLKGHRELAEAFELATLPDGPAVLILNGNVMSGAGATSAGLRSRASLVRRLVRLPRAAWRQARAALQRPPPATSSAWVPIAEIVERINRMAPRKRAIIQDLPRPELIQAYLNSDLFVLASNVEYSPLVLYEAAAAGLPFLSVPVGNAAEIAEWTGAGVVCPAPQDKLGYTRVEPAVLAEHISRVSSDRGRLASLGRQGRRRWSEQYTWAIVAGKYEELFARLIAERQAAHAGA